MEIRDVDTAQHEAAHVVVGVACGLRLRRGVIGYTRAGSEHLAGYTHFQRGGPPEGWALMYAAGVAWDRTLAIDPFQSSRDYRLLRSCSWGTRGAEIWVRAATAMLAGLRSEHVRVTRALLERDVTGADIAALCRGEKIED